MKKRYIKPDIEVIRAEPTLLCASSFKGGHHRPPHKEDYKNPWRPEAPWNKNFE